MSDAMTLQGLLKLAELYAAAAGYRSGTETEAGYSLICGGTTGGLESEIKAGHSLVRGGTESGLEDLEVSLLNPSGFTGMAKHYMHLPLATDLDLK